MNEIINEYGRQKIEEINGDPLMLQKYKAKAVEIIRNVIDANAAGYITRDEAAREIANAERTAAEILHGKKNRSDESLKIATKPRKGSPIQGGKKK